MTEFEEYGGFSNPRITYNLGHAAFEFMESKWGKEGIRQFVFSLRKSVIGGGNDAFEEAFRVKPDEFDQQFEKYLKDRFKSFRDKERPLDYGRNLAPNDRRTKYSSVLTIEPSPSGRPDGRDGRQPQDYELDIVLLSTKDGSVIRNLTPGFDQGPRLRIHRDARRRAGTRCPGCRGRRSAIASRTSSRTEKQSTLLIRERGLDRQDRAALPDEDHGRARVAVDSRPTADVRGLLRAPNAIGDIYHARSRERRNHQPHRRRRLPTTRRRFRPTASPSSTWRASAATTSCSARPGHQEEDAAHLRHARRRAAEFIDGTTLVFPSTAMNPTQPIDPRSRATATSTTSGR